MGRTCSSEMVRPTDFLKLSLFSKFGKGGALGLQCVSTMAKLCNQWVEGSIASCSSNPFRPSMVIVDFPTYVGQARSLIELADAENYKRAALVSKEQANQMVCSLKCLHIIDKIVILLSETESK